MYNIILKMRALLQIMSAENKSLSVEPHLHKTENSYTPSTFPPITSGIQGKRVKMRSNRPLLKSTRLLHTNLKIKRPGRPGSIHLSSSKMLFAYHFTSVKYLKYVLLYFRKFLFCVWVPAASPSRGGNVTVFGLELNQPR